MSCRFLGLNSSLTLLSSFSCFSTYFSSSLSFYKTFGPSFPPRELWLVVGGEAGWVTRARSGVPPRVPARRALLGLSTCRPRVAMLLFCSKAAARAHDDVVEL